jgi:cyclophilin family peptidyl-prolyl cis-trans isomerase/HEAT repeat protein
MTRSLPYRFRVYAAVALFALSMPACKTPPPPPPAPTISFEQKMVWILQLEDQRLLRQPAQPVPIEVPVRQGTRVLVAPPKPDSSPDLVVLVRDAEPRLRRRAALAIGRVRLKEGVQPLVGTLADTDPDVRAMAAFALGLIGDPAAEPSLLPLLTDIVPMVRGRAAEALGQIDATGSAAAIGKMVAEYARSAAVKAIQPDDETVPVAPEAEAFKLGVFALVRLRGFEPLSAAVLEGGRPVTHWWPVAFAFQRINDPRAAAPLLELLRGPGRYSRAFAARGLGGLREASVVKPLQDLLDPAAKSGLEVTVSAIRALAQIGARESAGTLIRIGADAATAPNVRLEAITALGAMGAAEALPLIQDLITDEWAAMRIAAMQAAAAIEQQGFVFVLATLEPDRDWHVRAALAGILGTLPPEIGVDRLRSMLEDQDKRVHPAVLAALVRQNAPDVGTLLLQRLNDPDFVVRASAASHVGKLKLDGGAAALREAYKVGLPDAAYAARAAALEALSHYGAAEAVDTLKTALADKDWAIRLRAAELLTKLEPGFDAEAAIRPAPGTPPAAYDDATLLGPEVSPHAFIETVHGTIELELAVLDAPQTTRNFMNLVRKGFFNGLEVHRVVPNFVMQDGDPRGDGEGGPGHTIRDELNERPYLRGTVGMALDWRDTGGSQFFITHSPAPHLDARYTAFGRVVNGMEVVDRIKVGDVIQRIRIWDGKQWQQR